MRPRNIVLAAVPIVGLAAWLTFGLQQETYGFQKEPSASTARYKVTNWPPDTVEEDYARIVERYLNEMAHDGWRLHSTLMGQKAKVLVFERAG